MTVAIVDYGSGNLKSATKAFERAMKVARLDYDVILTKRPSDLDIASHIVLPGVGAFADCKRGLSRIPDMERALEENVRHKKKPFLGICVGMQLMATIGREHIDTEGLGWLAGDIVPL